MLVYLLYTHQILELSVTSDVGMGASGAAAAGAVTSHLLAAGVETATGVAAGIFTQPPDFASLTRIFDLVAAATL